MCNAKNQNISYVWDVGESSGCLPCVAWMRNVTPTASILIKKKQNMLNFSAHLTTWLFKQVLHACHR